MGHHKSAINRPRSLKPRSELSHDLPPSLRTEAVLIGTLARLAATSVSPQKMILGDPPKSKMIEKQFELASDDHHEH